MGLLTGAGTPRELIARLVVVLQPDDMLCRDNQCAAFAVIISEANVEACQTAGTDPVIALGREAHHPSLAERSAVATGTGGSTPLEAMTHRLQTPEGSRGALGFRHFA